MERMTEEQLQWKERINTETSWTHNEYFERNGYLIIRNLWNPDDLYHPVPNERGQITYHGSIDRYCQESEKNQVNGSLERYSHPMYKQIHSEIRLKLENELGRKLYNTYYYDRFYFPGQELKKHIDRSACEISVTIHISSNLRKEWPIWIKTPDRYTDKNKKQILVPGENRAVILNPGDGMIYKGCERPHWRDPMPDGEDIPYVDTIYYHQIFFHYVLQDGIRAHCAWDCAS
jgi:hypothetical protein